MIRLLLLLLVSAAAFVFALDNRGQMIALRMPLGESTPPISVPLLVLGSFASGLVVAVLLVAPEWIRARLQVRRQRRQIAALEERLEAAPGPIAPDVAPPPDDQLAGGGRA
jgi:uncharacterized membrane protein YciS (DUF1049 family)